MKQQMRDGISKLANYAGGTLALLLAPLGIMFWGS